MGALSQATLNISQHVAIVYTSVFRRIRKRMYGSVTDFNRFLNSQFGSKETKI